MPSFDNAMHQIASLPTIAVFTQPDVDLTLCADVSAGFSGPIASKEQRPLEALIFPLVADLAGTTVPTASTTTPRAQMRVGYDMTITEARGAVSNVTGTAEDLSSDVMTNITTSIIDNTGTPSIVMTIPDSTLTTGAISPAVTSISALDALSSYVTQRASAVTGKAWKVYLYGYRV